MKAAVIQFPGSNCDQDCLHAAEVMWGSPGILVWHQELVLPPVDVVMLPGGFSYGDYLRAGAIATQSPIMRAIRNFAHDGGFVLGICNGFQILTESGLLPGALLRNRHLQFVCRDVHLRVENTDTPFTHHYAASHQPIRVPIAHMDGCYYAEEAVLDRLEAEGQVVFRYCDALGNISIEANPNGSCRNIAGICNAQRNVLGLMPHPERVVETLLGGADGRGLFESLQKSRQGAACRGQSPTA